MSSDNVIIEDCVKTKVYTINSFSVEVLQMNLFKNAILKIKFYNNGTFIESDNLEITGEDYVLWGTDDSYINSYVATKFNLTLLNS
jgi:hypothetical protein